MMTKKNLLSGMTIGKVLFLVCSILLLASFDALASATIPAVAGPIPVTAESHPFGAAAHTATPQDLSQFGYVEEEYLISGFANVYDLDSTGKVVVKTADAPYTTRILVRRPAAAKTFSGTVIVELLNPTAMYDLDLQWQFSRDYFIEHRDVWVGITSKPIAAKALKTFDPKRYGGISWANPLSADETCAKPTSRLPDSTPATENGLVWDIMSQMGALVKSNLSQNPLKGFAVKRVYATGYSQTGGYLVTYINFIRPLPTATLANGKPVFDGYLIGDGDGLQPSLHQCSQSVKPGDPGFVIQPRKEPVISLVSQSLIAANGLAQRADSDSPTDRYRRYEVPGASHINQRGVNLSPKPEDTVKALGMALPPPDCKENITYGMTDFPFEYFMNSGFANLDAWVTSGKVPPRVPRMAVRRTPTPPFFIAEVDTYGNALGGLRSPYMEVPIATYYGNSTPGNPIFALLCSLSGYKVPFGKDVLKQLYPTHAVYVNKVQAKVDTLVKSRLITKADAARIMKEAAKAAIP